MVSYRRQAVRGWDSWRQESRRSGRGRRRTVEDEDLVVSNQNRCVLGEGYEGVEPAGHTDRG